MKGKNKLYKLQNKLLFNKYMWLVELILSWRLIDWLLVFNAQAAIFQLYLGDEHEMDEKMNMKWWNEKWDVTQGNGVDKFWLPLEIGRGG